MFDFALLARPAVQGLKIGSNPAIGANPNFTLSFHFSGMMESVGIFADQTPVDESELHTAVGHLG